MSTVVPNPAPTPTDGAPAPAPGKTIEEALQSNGWAVLFGAVAAVATAVAPYLGMLPVAWVGPATAVVSVVLAIAKTWSQVKLPASPA